MDDSVKKEVSKLAWIPGTFELKLCTQHNLYQFDGYRADLGDLQKNGYIREFRASLNLSPSNADYFNPSFTIKVGWLNWFKLKFATLK